MFPRPQVIKISLLLMVAQSYEYTKNYSTVYFKTVNFIRELCINLKTAWVKYYFCPHFTHIVTKTQILVMCLQFKTKHTGLSTCALLYFKFFFFLGHLQDSSKDLLGYSRKGPCLPWQWVQAGLRLHFLSAMNVNTTTEARLLTLDPCRKGLRQGCQTHFHRGPHQPRGCLQRAEGNFWTV